jgi:hypothetical protein
MMKAVKQKLTLYQPAIYQIKVPGHLDESWSEWADGMTITVESGDDGSPVTTLTGKVADQPSLRGILTKIWDLNLVLISLIRVSEDSKL